MGVYIPPGSGSNGSNDSGKANSVSTRSSGGESGKIIFYNRPNVGLKIWGPLVPASDCTAGLWALTGLQMGIGMIMIANVRKIWHTKTLQARVSKWASSLVSGYLIFTSGLEVSRLTLPYDPWYEEAKEARRVALKEGKSVSYWFGPWDLKPMSFQEWNDRVDVWILNSEKEFQEEDDRGRLETGRIDFSQAGPIMHQAYLQARAFNQKRNSEILDQLQTNAFRDILPNYQTHSNFEMQRPELNIPEDNKLEDDFDLEEAWELNNPWASLSYDTHFIVRFIPKFRSIDQSSEHPLQTSQLQE